MKILLSHGYFLNEDPREQKIMRPYPPLGVLYISSWLEKHDFENEVFDTTFSVKQDLKDYLKTQKPDIVALYANLLTKINIVDVIRFIKSTEVLNHTLIVVGGPDTTYNIENYLMAGADLVVIGEGEQTMLDIVRKHKKKEDTWRSVAGVAFLLPDLTVFKTVAREKIKNLDDLPFPNRVKIDLSQYLAIWQTHHGGSAMSVSTQRGCPYTCKWCSTAVYGQSYRRRSASSVVDELEYLRDTYHPDQIWFVDDVFSISHKWIEAFHSEVISRGISVSFECITRAERLNDHILQLLKESGCFRIWIGAESGSQSVLDAMDRRVDAQLVQQMIRKTREIGIEAGTFIMLGYPSETEVDILKTLEYLKQANPDLVTYTLSYPIKGTVLYQEVEAELINQPDWQKSSDRDLDFRRTYPRKYYRYALPWIENSFLLYKKKQAEKFNFAIFRLYLLTKVLRLAMLVYRKPSKV